MEFTKEEKKLIYKALVHYGNQMCEFSTRMQADEDVKEVTSFVSKNAWKLADRIKKEITE